MNNIPAMEAMDFLASYPPNVQRIALELRRLVFSVAPDVMEAVDIPAHMLAYMFAQTCTDMLCVIIPLKNGVNLGFPMGAILNDPSGLLAGTDKRARHVRISNLEEAANPALKTLLLEALKTIRKQ